jgi:hypothetical protein
MFYPAYKKADGSSAGYAPNLGEYYPIKYSFSNIPSGMSFSYPGYTMYDGNDPCAHYSDAFLAPSCLSDSNNHLIFQPYGFGLYGNTNPGTYYITMTATEQLENGVTRAPFSHTYTFRLDVLGADVKANGVDGPTSVTSGDTATITWSSLTDPDPSGYSSSGAPTCSVTNNLNSDTWSGLSGSQSSGSLTSQAIYSVECTHAGISLSDSVTIDIASIIAPPSNVQAFNTSLDSTVPCGAIKVTYTPSPDVPAGNNGGTQLYRDGYYVSSGSPALDVLSDLDGAGSSHTYTVRASKEGSPGVWSYSSFATASPNPITATPCSSSLTTSDMDIAEVGGINHSFSVCSGETELSFAQGLYSNDVIRMAIHICNTGTSTVPNVSTETTLTNLSNPSNFQFTGCNTVTPQINDNTIELNGLGNITAGGICTIEFDVRITPQINLTDNYYRIQAQTDIYEGSSYSTTIRTPPILTSNGGSVPKREEVSL